MSYVYAVILGLVEGLTEFLPISSTGHLIITMPLLGVDGDRQPWPVFLFFIQIGAILAVIVYFAHDLWAGLVRRPTEGLGHHLLIKLMVAFIPAAVVGLTLDRWMERYLEHPIPVACALLLGAGAMEWVDRRFRRANDAEAASSLNGRDSTEAAGARDYPKSSGATGSRFRHIPREKLIDFMNENPRPPEHAETDDKCALELGGVERARATASIDQISVRQALLIGVAQCVSIIPGTSRSMATILGGMMVGLTPTVATQFSFYLAIPTLLAAGGYKLLKHRHDIHLHEAGLLLIGTVVAFIVAIVVVAWFLRYVAGHRFRLFALYRVILGVLVLFLAGTH